MARVRLHFYGALNEFLAPDRREREFEYRSARAASVKNAIEAVGVPHTEVERVLVNGEPVDFSYLVREGSHWKKMSRLLETLLSAPGSGAQRSGHD